MPCAKVMEDKQISSKKEQIDRTVIQTKNIRELLAGCCTMFLFAVFFKIGALERNAYWFHVKLIFVISANHLNQTSELNVSANHLAKN